MNNTTKKLIPLSRDSIQLVKGLLIGKLLTILVMGGLWFLVRQYFGSGSGRIEANQGGGEISQAQASSFRTVNNVPIGAFKYSGTTDWAPIRQLVHSLIQSDRPELQLQYAHPQGGSLDSETAVRMLLDGKIDFAQLSRSLTDTEYALAQQQGFTLKQRQVATDGVAVAVNPELEVSGLTVEQLQQIYLGKITNWIQLGGPDLPITAFSQSPEEIRYALFEGNNLDNLQLSSEVRYVNSPTEALRQVSKNKGSVYFGSARAIVPQCTVKPLPLGVNSDNMIAPYEGNLIEASQCPQKRNRINTKAMRNGSYPLKNKLFVVTKQNNNQEEQIGKAYTNLLLTDEGQEAISQAGFIPVR